MKLVRNILLFFLLCTTTALAAPASEATIRQLLEATESRKVVDSVQGQFDTLINKMVQQSLGSMKPTEAQQKAIDNMKGKMVALVQKDLSWEKLEPMYIRIYQESFTEEELAGMLEFYKTPAGQAVVKKMPLLIQSTTQEIQTITMGMGPSLQKIQNEFMAEVKKAK